jgi:hypothetical protein
MILVARIRSHHINCIRRYRGSLSEELRIKAVKRAYQRFRPGKPAFAPAIDYSRGVHLDGPAQKAMEWAVVSYQLQSRLRA